MLSKPEAWGFIYKLIDKIDMTKFNTLRRITKILVDVSAIVCYAGIGYFFYKIAPVIADFLVTVTK